MRLIFRQRVRSALAALIVASTGMALAAGPAAADPAALPSSFQWSSSQPLISPMPDPTTPNHLIVSVKDPSIIRYNGKWLVYMTTANVMQSWSLAFTSFTDWSQAASAPQYFLDQTPIGTGYRAAPQVFYFAPQQKWYLVYQTGVPSYSTNSDPSNPAGWSAPKNFENAMPAIIKQNIGSGYWVDFWVICNEVNCYLFSSDDNGHLYRAETTVADFPNGFHNDQIALSDARYSLYEASNVYKVLGTDQYLLLVEAIGSDGNRYFRSWTSTDLAGSWTPLAADESNPFARSTNVTFPGGAWTNDISHGEMVRAGNDQTLPIDPDCLQYLYQGKNPNVPTAVVPYGLLPWQLGLLTEVKNGQPCTG